MNSNMRSLVAYFSLARPLNVLLAFIAICLAGIIAGVAAPDFGRLTLAGIVGMALTAAANAMNDILDVEIDRVNKPERALVRGDISIQAVWMFTIVNAAIGLTISWFLSLTLFIITATSFLVICLYNRYLKRIPLIGNIVVGMVTGTAFLFGAEVAGAMSAGIPLAVMAFIFTVARELLKDIEDIEGDQLSGLRTFPIVYGIPHSLKLIDVFFCLVIVSSALPYLLHWYSIWYFILVIAGVDLVLCYSMLKLHRDSSRASLRRISSILKFDMFMGMIAVYIGSFH